jgi:hypothetical protein
VKKLFTLINKAFGDPETAAGNDLDLSRLTPDEQEEYACLVKTRRAYVDQYDPLPLEELTRLVAYLGGKAPSTQR